MLCYFRVLNTEGQNCPHAIVNVKLISDVIKTEYEYEVAFSYESLLLLGRALAFCFDPMSLWEIQGTQVFAELPDNFENVLLSFMREYLWDYGCTFPFCWIASDLVSDLVKVGVKKTLPFPSIDLLISVLALSKAPQRALNLFSIFPSCAQMRMMSPLILLVLSWVTI